MASKVNKDEKFENQDFDLFEALNALDKKDYGYYDRLTVEQQKKFVPYMMLLYMSCIKGSDQLQRYYLMATNEYSNKYFFNESIQKHPKLQWLMLCSSSPGIGKQFHQWIPNLPQNLTKLKTNAKLKDVKEYFVKIYPKVDTETINEISNQYVEEHKKKVYLSSVFPNLKLCDIETLSQLITNEDIAEYEKERGN